MDVVKILFFPAPLAEGINTGLGAELCTATDGRRYMFSEHTCIKETLQWAQARGYCKSGYVIVYIASDHIQAYDPTIQSHLIKVPDNPIVVRKTDDPTLQSHLIKVPDNPIIVKKTDDEEIAELQAQILAIYDRKRK